jgi:hypothetical protein
MSTPKSQLFRLIQKGRYLQRQGLLDGFEQYQDWRDEIIDVFESLRSEFEEIVQTPLQVENGIRWLEKTFQID